MKLITRALVKLYFEHGDDGREKIVNFVGWEWRRGAVWASVHAHRYLWCNIVENGYNHWLHVWTWSDEMHLRVNMICMMWLSYSWFNYPIHGMHWRNVVRIMLRKSNGNTSTHSACVIMLYRVKMLLLYAMCLHCFLSSSIIIIILESQKVKVITVISRTHCTAQTDWIRADIFNI